MQFKQSELAERGRPFGDVDAAHVPRSAVARRPDAFDEHERVYTVAFHQIDDHVEPCVEFGFRMRRDEHAVLGEQIARRRADDRRTMFVADEPRVAAHRA